MTTEYIKNILRIQISKTANVSVAKIPMWKNLILVGFWMLVLVQFSDFALISLPISGSLHGRSV